MRYRGGSVRRLALPVKGWVQRFSFALLVSASVGMMVLGKVDSKFVERLRVGVTDAVAPLLEALSQPSATAAAMVEEMRVLTDLRSENERLRAENSRLLQWQAVARTLEQENLAFKELLALVDTPHPAFITARVIDDAGGAFVRTVLLNAGSDDGVRVGQAAVNAEGLVGRVVELIHYRLAEERDQSDQPVVSHEEIAFSVRLVVVAMFGDALIGEDLGQVGLGERAEETRRFRSWLADLMVGLLSRNPTEPGE